MVGYLPAHEDARSGEGPAESTIGYRLVRDCLLKNAARPWYVEEMTAVLATSISTAYRYLNRLKALDLLEEVSADADGKGRKGYRFRYGSLAQAWDFTEANAQNALRRYRETVNHLQRLIEAAQAAMARPAAVTPSTPKERKGKG